VASKPKPVVVGDIGKASLSPEASANLAKLMAQINQQRARLAAQGGAVPQAHHPSILNRVLDVISRPNYAMAGMFNNVWQDMINKGGAKNAHLGLGTIAKDMGSGFVKGLEGKSKARFSDMMSNAVQAGAATGPFAWEKNRIARTGVGLLADITTDPLTYIGPGIEKAVPAAGIEAGGAAAKAIESGAGPGAKALDLYNAAEAARQGVGKPGALSLEVLGKPVLKSEAAYEALAKIGRPIANTETAQALRRSLSTAAAYPGKLKQFWRVGKQAGVANFIDFDKSMTEEIAKHLTADEGTRVSKAIEQGVSLAGQTSKSGGLDLGDAQKYWLDHVNGWSQEERALGIHRPGQFMDNYIPPYFKTSAEKKAFMEQFGSRFSQATKLANQGNTAAAAAKLPTLTEIEAAGFHPHTNIVDVMKMRAAQHWRDVGKASFFHNAVAEYGVEAAGKGAKAAEKAARDQGLVKLTYKDSEHAAGRNIFVPPEVKRAIGNLNKFYASEEDTAKLLRQFDQVQRIWKTGVTTINPGHHMRNMAGDIFLNYEAGVTNPADYKRAYQVLFEHPGDMVLGNTRLSNAEVHNFYKIKGGASGFFNTELVGSRLGAPLEWLRDITAKREDLMRLANFTHEFRTLAEREGASTMADLDRIAEKAAAKVRKFNFDYGDLTPFETSIRRVVPFYTFMRKNIPLQLEMLALHPNKIARIPQGFNALASILGTDPQHLPVTEVIPDYIKQMGAVRLRGEGDGGQALYGELPNPVTDALQLFGTGSPNEMLRKGIGQTFFPLRMAAELGFQRSAYSGAPIGSNTNYLINQFPISRNILKTAAPHQPNRVVQPGETVNANPLFDWAAWLAGGRVTPITNQMELSELKRQQSPVQAKLRTLRNKRINQAIRDRGKSSFGKR